MGSKNLLPTTNYNIQVISGEVYQWWKKYSGLTNASPNKNLHFTDKVWEEIIGYTDDNGVHHIGSFDEVYNKYPYEFTSNLLMAFFNELRARADGAYHEEEVIFGG